MEKYIQCDKYHIHKASNGTWWLLQKEGTIAKLPPQESTSTSLPFSPPP
eukprot:CAMPEP_0113579324 /NCGR_PEP_ID=MMETSP0015_2-20120614/30008_1 /TAXON_ID=2838 /ORGANISM="Odontella" /LENGTH=48 /DNA_ID=CAMNT_0000483297 /DNA_START=501 /DNA_END=644 /DNA_ORIENTATION=+ /assembly_acc=CAM_ASM_000160